MKEHAKVDEWRTGGFQVERHVLCRCGWKCSHYNRGYLNERYREHVAGAVEVSGSTEGASASE